MEFVGEGRAIVAALAALAGARRVAALQDEAAHEAMEHGVVVVAIETQLQEVARRNGCLLGEELELEVAEGGVENELGRGIGLDVVRRTHCRRAGAVFSIAIWTKS